VSWWQQTARQITRFQENRFFRVGMESRW
jgi:hypothetical protein